MCKSVHVDMSEFAYLQDFLEFKIYFLFDYIIDKNVQMHQFLF